MSVSPRQYLLDRFRADAVALRERAAALKSGAKQPGPDAATSARMAAACDDVAAMIAAIPEAAEIDEMLNALSAIIPLLEQHAAKTASTPPVRAVFVGAVTRVREIVEAERRAMSSTQTSALLPGEGVADIADDEFDDDRNQTSDDDTDDDIDDDIDDDDLAFEDDDVRGRLS